MNFDETMTQFTEKKNPSKTKIVMRPGCNACSIPNCCDYISSDNVTLESFINKRDSPGCNTCAIPNCCDWKQPMRPGCNTCASRNCCD